MKRNDQQRREELEFIKEQYVGAKRHKKQIVKPSEKFRFSFDWDNNEDTSRDYDPIYQNPHEARLLFGRGFRAGIDRREQKLFVPKDEDDLWKEGLWSKDTKQKMPQDVARYTHKTEAASTYDKFDMHVGGHGYEKKVEEMTQRDWRIFQEDFNISYNGSRVPHPMRNWEEGALIPKILKVVKKVEYSMPSPIQMAAIPIGLQRRDMIGVAETGSGKTVAYVLPMLTYISKLPRLTEETSVEGPYAVVLAPTRELAKQIHDETVKFAQYLNVHVVLVVGGNRYRIEDQGFKLSQGCEIVIATPGRLLDCLDRKYVVLNQCNYVVLDEADRMIDIGFEQQVISVLAEMPSNRVDEKIEHDANKRHRTTCMFSATMSDSVKRLARNYLQDHVVVTIGTTSKVVGLIAQNVMMVKEGEKWANLSRMMRKMGDERSIVFVNTKTTANAVCKQLENHGWQATVIHGGKTQEQREASLDGFKNKHFNCLVATDVVGRGIDILDVVHVINYDMAGTIDKYTHRIGRTGRAGNTGVATTFLTPQDFHLFDDLKDKLVEGNNHVPPELARHKKTAML